MQNVIQLDFFYPSPKMTTDVELYKLGICVYTRRILSFCYRDITPRHHGGLPAQETGERFSHLDPALQGRKTYVFTGKEIWVQGTLSTPVISKLTQADWKVHTKVR